VAEGEGDVWRVSLAPTDGFAFVESLRREGAPLVAHVYDWAGGLVWLRLESARDAHAGVIRAIVDRLGGHATLIRADAATRAAVEVFHPQPPALAALTRRVKEAFDPRHILERGRMRAEF
jgi:glycolate oxidase FAD binding subunit